MSQEKKVLINSPFVRPVDREEVPSSEIGDSVYYDRKIYMEYVETGTDENGKSIGSVKPVIKEKTIDIDKLINSHAKEVGLKNLIQLYVRTGDSSLFSQRQSINSMTGGFVDLTAIPEESASEIYSKIPDELKGDQSMEQFLKSLTQEQFAAFVEALRAKTEEKKEEVVSNE